MVVIPIWPGSSSFSPGDTPFGFYDDEAIFTQQIDKAAKWAATRLGYPIVDVELQPVNFYACFEEAVYEYTSQVNQFNIRQNMLNLQGASTGSNLSGKLVNANLGRLVSIADEYGQEVGVGGEIDFKTGSIQLQPDVQNYDLKTLFNDIYEPDGTVEVKRIFHYRVPASSRFFDPYLGNQALLDAFGFGPYSTGVQFMLMPVYYDLLRIQAIEFNDEIRKSAYSFDLRNNKLTIFPIPSEPITLYFTYILKEDRSNPIRKPVDGLISDYSNAPYGILPFSSINDVGRAWIYSYFLALCKEMLGYIRGKYLEIPIPNAEVTLNYSELIDSATVEKERLIKELQAALEETSRKTQLEKKKLESDAIRETLSNVPLKIYIG
jgi:hypothetical protein